MVQVYKHQKGFLGIVINLLQEEIGGHLGGFAAEGPKLVRL
jgi:hypothetical protein